jgi:uncharacterized protein (TIGR00251 family)
MQFLQENSRGIKLKVFIQPRSSKNMIVGVHDDAIKIKLTAAPVGGAANKMCIKYLAKRLQVPTSSIEIISGQNSRKKLIYIKYKNKTAAEITEPERIRGSIVSLLKT